MKKYLIIIISILFFASIVYAKIGLDLSLSLGSGSATVGGPITSEHYLLIDGSSHYLLIDNASHKLRIDGAN
jgi:hypothetical protein